MKTKSRKPEPIADGDVAVIESKDGPTGHIMVGGEPMAFWMPPGVAAPDFSIGAAANEN